MGYPTPKSSEQQLPMGAVTPTPHQENGARVCGHTVPAALQASEDAKETQNRVSTSQERAGERVNPFLTPIASPRAPRRGRAQAVTALELRPSCSTCPRFGRGRASVPLPQGW